VLVKYTNQIIENKMAVQTDLPPKSNELLRFFFASFSQGFAGFCTK